jgi:hypothetical protein
MGLREGRSTQQDPDDECGKMMIKQACCAGGTSGREDAAETSSRRGWMGGCLVGWASEGKINKSKTDSNRGAIRVCNPGS